MVAQMAMAMMSSSLCRLLRSILGSSKEAKQAIIDAPSPFIITTTPYLTDFLHFIQF